MIIVSQDKNIVVNFDNISHIFIDEWNKTTIKCGRMSGCCEALGHYKTEERAKEVLKAITEIYQANKLIECCKDITTQNQITEKFLEAKMTPFKYEMPKE